MNKIHHQTLVKYEQKQTTNKRKHDEKDSNGNVTYGDVVLHNSHNSYFRTDGLLLAAIGVDNLVLVATKDVIMVANKDNVQNVKAITKELEDDARSEWAINREVYRPWGKFDAIDTGDRYQVKRITVKPGAKLSLQMHHHRAEHWVVVSGTARVTNGDKIYWGNLKKLIDYLAKNEEEYIKKEYNLRNRMEKREFSSNTPNERQKKYLNIPIKNRDVEKLIDPYSYFWQKRYYK